MSWTDRLDHIKTKLICTILMFDAFFRKPLIKKILFGLIIILSFLLVYVLNILHPLFGDDWFYSMHSNSNVPIHNFGDILHTQYEHYFTWGGRSVVHIIAQSLLLSGVAMADFLNSLAYLCLTLVIYVIANQSKEIRPSLLIAINFLVWFFQPAFGSTILWITGSANYLWGTLIIISFLFFYTRLIYTDNSSYSTMKSILFLPFGIIAGWTNENIAVALIFMLIVLFLYLKALKKQIPLWAILGLLGTIIGCVFMIVAPGNYVRMESVLTNESASQSLISLYLVRLLASMSAYYYYALATTFIYSLTIILYITYGMNKRKHIMFVSLLFFLGAIVATLAMSASPIFPGRASFGINILIFIAIAILFANLDFSKSIIRSLTYTILSFALLFFVVDYNRAYKTLESVNQHDLHRLAIVEKGKKEGKKDFILNDRINPENPYLHYFELTPDSTDWHNRMFSKYYGIKSIIIK